MYYAPAVTNKEYKKEVYITCPLRWQRSALECLHEGAEAYMVSLLETPTYWLYMPGGSPCSQGRYNWHEG